MKLIGYIRVSSMRQAKEGVSLAAQEEKIRGYCRFVGSELVSVEVDRGYSGSRSDRPAFNAVVRRVVAGEADALIVYAIDRLSRSSFDFLHTVRRLTDAGRGFVSCREQLDSTTPHGRFTLTILAAMAQMEGELISVRAREAKARCRAEGRPVNARTYGLCYDGTGRVRQDPEEVEIIDRIMAMREEKVSYQRIADWLNGNGHAAPRGGLWARASVRSVEMTQRRNQ